jgi:predicted nucleic acid-binding protein
MYLVDTSVWIDYFRGATNKATDYFSDILERKIFFGVAGVIYQEILQGAGSITDFNKLAAYLGTQHFFHPKDEILTYESAAQLYFVCHRKGLTVRSSIDCLIAQIAIERQLILLHSDRDYEYIKQVVPELALCP